MLNEQQSAIHKHLSFYTLSCFQHKFCICSKMKGNKFSQTKCYMRPTLKPTFMSCINLCLCITLYDNSKQPYAWTSSQSFHCYCIRQSFLRRHGCLGCLNFRGSFVNITGPNYRGRMTSLASQTQIIATTITIGRCLRYRLDSLPDFLSPHSLEG